MNENTLVFLQQLKANNNKDWFDSHRSDYQAAREDFVALLTIILEKLSLTDPSVANMDAKACVFRIHRDVRFSKDKSPYKINFGASICKYGRQSDVAGYYVHIQPGDNSFVGGGLWRPEPKQLQSVRQEIDYNGEEWTRILHSKYFKKHYGDLSRDEAYRLKREPKGYERTHPLIEDLKLKSFIASHALSDRQLMHENVAVHIAQNLQVLQPFIQFINRAMED